MRDFTPWKNLTERLGLNERIEIFCLPDCYQATLQTVEPEYRDIATGTGKSISSSLQDLENKLSGRVSDAD
jgi:hypothetical protein